jgi:hypothetical protein
MTKKFIEHSDPTEYLFEHILKGDSGDGVPNVLSPDNTFSDSIRQSPMTKKKIEGFRVPVDQLPDVMGEEVYRNYCRNKRMIDLTQTPTDLVEEINKMYEESKPAHQSKVLNYLIKKRCKLLIECAGEFL